VASGQCPDQRIRRQGGRDRGPRTSTASACWERQQRHRFGHHSLNDLRGGRHVGDVCNTAAGVHRHGSGGTACANSSNPTAVALPVAR